MRDFRVRNLRSSGCRAERKAQVISLAYGNVKLHNPAITREDVERFDFVPKLRGARNGFAFNTPDTFVG